MIAYNVAAFKKRFKRYLFNTELIGCRALLKRVEYHNFKLIVFKQTYNIFAYHSRAYNADFCPVISGVFLKFYISFFAFAAACKLRRAVKAFVCKYNLRRGIFRHRNGVCSPCAENVYTAF